MDTGLWWLFGVFDRAVKIKARFAARAKDNADVLTAYVIFKHPWKILPGYPKEF
jgi:hypothetical protein